MAHVLQPGPGMDICDPTCGSGRLLTKCEVEMERGFSNPRIYRDAVGLISPCPLALFGA